MVVVNGDYNNIQSTVDFYLRLTSKDAVANSRIMRDRFFAMFKQEDSYRKENFLVYQEDVSRMPPIVPGSGAILCGGEEEFCDTADLVWGSLELEDEKANLEIGRAVDSASVGNLESESTETEIQKNSVDSDGYGENSILENGKANAGFTGAGFLWGMSARDSDDDDFVDQDSYEEVEEDDAESDDFIVPDSEDDGEEESDWGSSDEDPSWDSWDNSDEEEEEESEYEEPEEGNSDEDPSWDSWGSSDEEDEEPEYEEPEEESSDLDNSDKDPSWDSWGSFDEEDDSSNEVLEDDSDWDNSDSNESSNRGNYRQDFEDSIRGSKDKVIDRYPHERRSDIRGRGPHRSEGIRRDFEDTRPPHRGRGRNGDFEDDARFSRRDRYSNRRRGDDFEDDATDRYPDRRRPYRGHDAGFEDSARPPIRGRGIGRERYPEVEKTEPIKDIHEEVPKVVESPKEDTWGTDSELDEWFKDLGTFEGTVNTSEPVKSGVQEAPKNKVQKAVYEKPDETVVDVPKDLREFVSKYPNCEISFALKFFSKREIDKQLNLGRLYKRKNRLFLT